MHSSHGRKPQHQYLTMTKSSIDIPHSLQFELALLWRSLLIVRSIDDAAVASFYEEFSKKLTDFYPLCLSAYWDDKKNLVGVEKTENDARPSILQLNELKYLNGRLDSSHKNSKDYNDFQHDPLGIVCNLYDIAAEMLLKANSISNKENHHRNTLLSTCLAIAIKSGTITSCHLIPHHCL